MKKMMICMIAILAALVMNANEASVNTQSRDNSTTSHVDMVKAHGTDIYNLYFIRGQEAEVIVTGDGDTDLEVYVYDENDYLVASDIDYYDGYVNWTPKRSGYFKVIIKNLGNISNRYLLLIEGVNPNYKFDKITADEELWQLSWVRFMAVV